MSKPKIDFKKRILAQFDAYDLLNELQERCDSWVKLYNIEIQEAKEDIDFLKVTAFNPKEKTKRKEFAISCIKKYKENIKSFDKIYEQIKKLREDYKKITKH